jgi:hypothetical protein
MLGCQIGRSEIVKEQPLLVSTVIFSAASAGLARRPAASAARASFLIMSSP